MNDALRIAIIGDYNFAYHSHNATNQALQHAEKVLEIQINYYWLNERECCEDKVDFHVDYDGIIIAPGPYRQPFYFESIISKLLQKKIPVLGTGDCFKLLIETHFQQKGYDITRERIVSENLIEGNFFTGVSLEKFSPAFLKLYSNKGTTEYSSSRFSVLPQYSELLNETFEIGARNQYFDPEILKSKTHPFFMFTMFCPQITSTIDIPHPIFTYFIKNVSRIRESNDLKN